MSTVKKPIDCELPCSILFGQFWHSLHSPMGQVRFLRVKPYREYHFKKKSRSKLKLFFTILKIHLLYKDEARNSRVEARAMI